MCLEHGQSTYWNQKGCDNALGNRANVKKITFSSALIAHVSEITGKVRLISQMQPWLEGEIEF